jgi:mono/diheme cytochrome c family protein
MSAGNARCMKIAVLGATLLAVSFPGHAQTGDIGKREYLDSCAICRGESGKGDGLVAALLKGPPSDPHSSGRTIWACFRLAASTRLLTAARQ